MKQKKEKSIFRQEMDRDFSTFQRLHGKKKIQFIFDYYKWYILAGIFCLLVILTFANIFYQGNKPYRIRTLAVLNTDANCKPWFDAFEEELTNHGKDGEISLNAEQPFSRKDMYFYVEQIEVQTSIANKRTDLVIGGKDLYQYVLMMKGCYPLDEVLEKKEVKRLKKEKRLLYSSAGLKENKDGSFDDSEAIKGYYAIDISNTAFGKKYNKSKKPLYAFLTSTNQNIKDSLVLLRKLSDL